MHTVHLKFAVAKPVPKHVAAEQRPSRAARMLALAHHIERAIEAGDLRDYATAARALGLTRARMTQVVRLLLLAPEMQERVLVGGTGETERSLRAAVRYAEWSGQAAPVAGIVLMP